MKRVRHNLKFQWVSAPKAFHKAQSLILIYSLISPSFIWAQEDEAPNDSTKSAIVQHGSMQGALSVLTKLNQAMETAAQNPNDDWRRDEVRKAVQAVPSAIQSVAGTFAVNTMGNSALPFVLSTLGSAVDVNAPNSFDKHLKNPNPDPIQRSGYGLSEKKAPVQELTYVVKEEVKEFDKTQIQSENKIEFPRSDIAQVTFTSMSLEPVTVPAPKTEFSEMIREQEAEKNSKPLFSKVPPPSEVISSLHEDIAVAEAIVEKTTNELRKRDLTSEEGQDLLSETTPKNDSKPKKRESRRTPILKPTSRLLLPLFFFGYLENEAHANGGAGGGQPGVGNPANGSPTNPGDQGGGGAGQILFGLAAIIGAVSPMIVAGQQAQSQENIANTQAQAQIQQAEIQTSTQKEMAQLSAQTALAQAQVQQQVAKMNNDAQTERLNINLAASQQQRNEQRQAEAEQLAMQSKLEAQKVALAMQKADQDILTARQSLEAQKLQLALAGSSAAANANSVQANTLSRTAGGSPIAAALNAQAATESATTAGARPASGRATTARALMTPTNRLLASADDGVLGAAENIPAIRNVLNRARRGVRRGLAATRGAPLNNARGFYRSGLATLAAGSFPEGVINTRRDLSQFAIEVEQGQSNTGLFEARRSIRQSQGRSSHSGR